MKYITSYQEIDTESSMSYATLFLSVYYWDSNNIIINWLSIIVE